MLGLLDFYLFIILFRRRRFLRPGRLLPDAAVDRDPGAREDSFRLLFRRGHRLHGPQLPLPHAMLPQQQVHRAAVRQVRDF